MCARFDFEHFDEGIARFDYDHTMTEKIHDDAGERPVQAMPRGEKSSTMTAGDKAAWVA